VTDTVPQTEAAPAAPETDGPILHCRGLSRTFQSGETELHVLRGVDFDLFERELVAVVGASGTGKSTLLHLLGLLDTPTAGEIFYRGRNLTKLGPEASSRVRNREFGFVFQSFHLLPEFTALENVMLPARIGAGSVQWMKQAADIRKRAANLLETVGLKDRLHHVPTRLSGGERQRVALARALVNQPSVVFCDEPTGNLDSRTAEGIFELIHKFIAENGQTFLIVTHDEQIAQRAGRQLAMDDGRLAE
jgi:lipoprotein-releasing system ATP-binding protein